MRLTYDIEADAFYIYIRDEDVPAVDSIDLEAGITADLDADGRVLGIEILDASLKTGQPDNVGVAFEILRSESIPA